MKLTNTINSVIEKIDHRMFGLGAILWVLALIVGIASLRSKGDDLFWNIKIRLISLRTARRAFNRTRPGQRLAGARLMIAFAVIYCLTFGIYFWMIGLIFDPSVYLAFAIIAFMATVVALIEYLEYRRMIRIGRQTKMKVFRNKRGILLLCLGLNAVAGSGCKSSGYCKGWNNPASAVELLELEHNS